jgi:hypothetical protein
MQLHEYPEAIAEKESALLTAGLVVGGRQVTLNRITAVIDADIAHDETLKNENQRKARRVLLLADGNAEAAVHALEVAETNKKEIEIELNQLRNEFSVAKLYERRAIAEMEIRAAA